MISDKVIKFSPSWNVLVIPSVPEELYLMYNVSNLSIESDIVNLLITVAVTPVVSPLIFILLSTNTFVYALTGRVKWTGSILTQSYILSYVVPPGITTDPSLKK